MVVGSYTGSYVPVLWGDNFFSVASILLGAAGGAIGIYIGYKLSLAWGLD